MNIKEDLILTLHNQRNIHIDFEELGDITRAACYACRDFSNVYADISFGGLGSHDGFTSTVIRTKIGEEIYNSALKEGYLIEPNEKNTSIKKSEMLAKIISFGKRKYERYAKALKEREAAN